MRMKRRGFLVLTLLALVLSAVVGAVLWQRVQTTSLAAVEAEWQLRAPLASRCAAQSDRVHRVVLAADHRMLVKHDALGAEDPAVLASQRWRIVTWLMVLELILGQEMLNRFFGV